MILKTRPAWFRALIRKLGKMNVDTERNFRHEQNFDIRFYGHLRVKKVESKMTIMRLGIDDPANIKTQESVRHKQSQYLILQIL